MLFTTKAEYGVRLLVALGLHASEAPTSLKAVAELEGLPMGYLEHIAALLRKAGLVESTRGAHGGYRLARDPERISMDEVLLALEGMVVPMDCFVVESDQEGPGLQRVMCSHELDHGRSCATKLLWMRVQGGVSKALAGTSLAELVEFSARAEQGQRAGELAQGALHTTGATELLADGETPRSQAPGGRKPDRAAA